MALKLIIYHVKDELPKNRIFNLKRKYHCVIGLLTNFKYIKFWLKRDSAAFGIYSFCCCVEVMAEIYRCNGVELPVNIKKICREEQSR